MSLFYNFLQNGMELTKNVAIAYAEFATGMSQAPSKDECPLEHGIISPWQVGLALLGSVSLVGAFLYYRRSHSQKTEVAVEEPRLSKEEYQNIAKLDLNDDHLKIIVTQFNFKQRKALAHLSEEETEEFREFNNAEKAIRLFNFKRRQSAS